MSQPYIAQSPDQMPSREVLSQMSGLEFLQALLEGKLAGPPISQTLNMRLMDVAKGHARFRGTPEFSSLNPLGGVHGGWYGALLDSALGCAVMTVVPKGAWYTTLEYKVNLTRAIPVGREVECVGTIVHAGRTTGVAEAVIRGVADGKIYATGSTTCLIMAL